MRPKIVLPLLLVGVAGLAVILFYKPAGNRPETAETVIVPPTVTSPDTKAVPPEVPPPVAPPVAETQKKSARPIPFTIPEPTGEDAPYIQAQLDRLDELEANNDDASLQAILKELTNTNQLVRHAAIEATIQFGGHSAVPVLQDLAARTSDPEEKKELLDAAEFLALPTISEAREEMKQKKMQEAAPSQDAVPPQ
jgi:hypothetical protein